MVGMGHSGGIGVLYLWFTVGGLRSPRASVGDSHQTGSDPYCGTASWAVSLGVSWGVDMFIMCENIICESSGG